MPNLPIEWRAAGVEKKIYNIPYICLYLSIYLFVLWSYLVVHTVHHEQQLNHFMINVMKQRREKKKVCADRLRGKLV